MLTFAIKASHSLAKAPTTIIINKTADILSAIGTNDLMDCWNLVFMNNPNPTGIEVIKNIVNPNVKRFIGGAALPMKCSMENPVIIVSVTTVMMLMTAV